MNKHRILIVEDEIDLASTLEKYLQHADFDTKIISNGAEVEPWLESNQASLILLDRLLPEKDGITICQSIREYSAIPIIMVTALQGEEDRLLGLEVGADDYICKPFSAREVVARVKTVLRRIQPISDTPKTSDNIQLDDNNERLLVNNQDADLTSVEYKLFKLMYSNPEQTFNRQDIMDAVYDDYRVVSDRSIDSHIKNLRKKFDCFELEGQSIKSVYGKGYKYTCAKEML